ncbi:MAG: hypothetical protein JWL67_1496 [Solirubrobacterales bacterium]|nr:hypothetical protein [Solirubrobacterales bacterium]
MRAVILAIICTLLLVGSAQATTPLSETPEAAVPALPVAGGIPEGSVPPVPVTEPAGEPVPPVPSKEPPPEPVPPAKEVAPEAVTPPPVPAGSPEAPPPVPANEQAPEAAPVPLKDETHETVAVAPVKEEAWQGSPQPAPPGAGDAATPNHVSGEAGQVTPGPSIGVLSAAAEAQAAEDASDGSSGGSAAGGAAAAAAIAQRPGSLSCELSALGGGPNRCAPGLLVAEPLLSSSPTGLVSAVAALAVPATGKDGGPPDGGHGGSSVLRPPVSPAPSPAPSGVSGGSATGPSGLALSGFLTLAGLLMLAAPRAMRRLRLTCQLRLTACFVLIPERPG